VYIARNRRYLTIFWCYRTNAASEDENQPAVFRSDILTVAFIQSVTAWQNQTRRRHGGERVPERKKRVPQEQIPTDERRLKANNQRDQSHVDGEIHGRIHGRKTEIARLEDDGVGIIET
jgi:hypothetical protein